MALIQNVDTRFGVQATYWNIREVCESFDDQILIVQVTGYVDLASYTIGSEPLLSQGFRFDTTNGYLPDATRTDLYALLKTTPFFNSAVDG